MKHTAETPLLAEACRQRLDLYMALLLDWNHKINLVSRADQPRLWSRHILDSAQLMRLLPDEPTPIIDIGSGAGFPGLVLALVSSHHVHLIEADQRKAAFLREAVRTTGAAATVHAVRAEGARLPLARVIIARGVAPLPALLTLAAPLMAVSGICLFPKGRGVDDELTAAANGWQMRIERFPSVTGPDATLLRISEIHRAGRSS